MLSYDFRVKVDMTKYIDSHRFIFDEAIDSNADNFSVSLSSDTMLRALGLRKNSQALDFARLLRRKSYLLRLVSFFTQLEICVFYAGISLTLLLFSGQTGK